MKRILYFTFAVALLVTTAFADNLELIPGHVPDDGEPIPTVMGRGGFSGRAPSYLVLVKVSGSPLGSWAGSGAFITQRLVLTCDHNVRGLKSTKPLKIQCMDGTMYTNIEIAQRSPRYDLALLRIKDPHVDRHHEIEIQDTHSTTPQIVALGYDPQKGGMALYRGKFDGRQYGNGRHRKPVFRGHSCKVVQGMSGGPLVDQEYCLIGVHSASSKATGSLATRIECIREFLDRWPGPYDSLRMEKY